MGSELNRVVSKSNVSETQNTQSVVSGGSLIQRSKTGETKDTTSSFTVSKSKSTSSDVELEKDLSKVDNGTLNPKKSNAFVSFFKKLFGGGDGFTDLAKVAEKEEKKLQQKGNLTIPEGQTDDSSVKNPGLKCKLTKDLTIGTTTFKKGEVCIAYEKGGDTFIQKMKETEKNGKKETSLGGALKLDNKDSIKSTDQKFVKTDKPLFEEMPSIKDIKQGAIGDCYLIAGIYSITNKDPQAIKNMIKDNGDGTVTVKLFDKVKDGITNEDTFKEKYITFEKSTVKGQGHAEDKLWVQMLEKAYAIHKGSYEAIGQGGHTNDVFEAFLGKKSEKISIASSSPTIKNNIINSLPMYSITKDKINELKEALKGFQIPHEIITGRNEAITEEQIKLFDKLDIKSTNDGLWGDIEKLGFTEKQAGKLLNKVQSFFETTDTRTGFNQLMEGTESYKKLGTKAIQTQEDFGNIITELKSKYNDKSTIQVGAKTLNVYEVIGNFEARKTELSPKDTMDHKGVTSNYTDKQTKVFNDIKQYLKDGHNVSVSTKTDIGFSIEKGKSAGESIVNGLAGQHAYALLDIVEMNGRKFVKIANPWGDDTSRDYTVKDGELVAKKFDKKDYSYLPKSQQSKEGGGINPNESWVELKEFGTLFDNIYVTK